MAKELTMSRAANCCVTKMISALDLELDISMENQTNMLIVGFLVKFAQHMIEKIQLI